MLPLDFQAQADRNRSNRSNSRPRAAGRFVHSVAVGDRCGRPGE